MGAGSSVPTSVEDALQAGHSQKEIDTYQAIEELFSSCDKSIDGKLTCGEVLGVLGKHENDDELRKQLDLPTNPGTSVKGLTNAFDETVKKEVDGRVIDAGEFHEFLKKYKAGHSSNGATEATAAVEGVDASTSESATNKGGFVMEFKASEMSGRPATSKVPARFKNRPLTSRRAKKGGTRAPVPKRKQAPATKKPETVQRKKSVEEETAYKAIEELFEKSEKDTDGKVTRDELIKTLDAHTQDDDLCLKLGLPSTAEPATAEPATAEPATAEPATAEPATAEPAAAEPATAEPAAAEPAAAEPAAAEPATAELATIAEPATETPAGEASPPAPQTVVDAFKKGYGDYLSAFNLKKTESASVDEVFGFLQRHKKHFFKMLNMAA